MEEPLLPPPSVHSRGTDETRQCAISLASSALASLVASMRSAAGDFSVPSLRELLKWARRWWRITTDPGLLESRTSRRRCWQWLWPLLSIVITIADYTASLNGSGNPASASLDAILVVLACALAWRGFPIGNVLLDVVIGTLVTGSIFYEQQTATIEVRSCSAFGVVSYVEVCVFMSLIGMHSIVVILNMVFCIITALTTESLLHDAGPMVVVTLFASIGMVCLEYFLASMFHELQSQLDCNQRLLDFATDGFGIVDTRTRVLSNMSPKMAQTLGVKELQGFDLGSFVDLSDHPTLARFLGQDASSSASTQPEAVLVTCHTGMVQFDARLVPYKLHEDSLRIGFCIQMLGEVRSVTENAADVKYSSGASQGALEDGMVEFEQQQTPDALEPAEPREQERELVFDLEEGGGTYPDHYFQLHHVVPSQLEIGAARPRLTRGPSSQQAHHRDDDDARSTTLSISTWTVSAAGTVCQCGPECKRLQRFVSTSTIGVQTGGDEDAGGKPGKPPRPPQAARKVSPDAQAPHRGCVSERRSRRKRTPDDRRPAQPKVCVNEGVPALEQFAATPRRTRVECLSNLVQSFNTTGTGCCSKHLVWTAINSVVMEELAKPCATCSLHQDWQCSECMALNAWEDEDEQDGEQLCRSCCNIVEPLLPGEHSLRAAMAVANHDGRSDALTMCATSSCDASESSLDERCSPHPPTAVADCSKNASA
mmetsp:Transcript_46873/g.111570  ORF Transcript_46873/g.111570 Transcript_46873/m.111570 type:complete len:711 (-) Transcript_46873:352-2484(-)